MWMGSLMWDFSPGHNSPDIIPAFALWPLRFKISWNYISSIGWDFLTKSLGEKFSSLVICGLIRTIWHCIPFERMAKLFAGSWAICRQEVTDQATGKIRAPGSRHQGEGIPSPHQSFSTTRGKEDLSVNWRWKGRAKSTEALSRLVAWCRWGLFRNPTNFDCLELWYGRFIEAACFRQNWTVIRISAKG